MDVAVDTQWILQRHSVTTESRPPASWTRDVCLVFPRRMPWSTLETRGDGAPSSIRQFPRLDTLIVIVRHVLESRCNEQDTKQSTVITQADLHRAHLAYNSQIIQVCWASPTDNCKIVPKFPNSLSSFLNPVLRSIRNPFPRSEELYLLRGCRSEIPKSQETITS